MYFNFLKKPCDKDSLFLNELRTAYLDLNNAQHYFDNTRDVDLIDYAVYRLEAAKARYSYFLKKAKKDGITGETVYNA